jgi:ATP-dependent DNA helicase RecG
MQRIMSDSQSIDLAAKRSRDSLPIKQTTPDLLDMGKVVAHIRHASERGRYHGPTDPEAYLRHRRCLIETDAGVQATMAGLICFGRDPQATFPRAVVDIGHYRGIEPISHEVIHLEKGVGGTIFEQIDRVETYLWANTHHGMTIGDGARRVEIHEYPRVVIRELVVNMLAHRDYEQFNSACRVQLFRNRIEWLNPGGLPEGVTIDNILAEQQSRNPTIVEVLYDAGYIEAFGQGLDTVFAVLKQEGIAPPALRDTGASFIVTVAGRAWELFSSDPILARLNDNQRIIIGLIRARSEISPRDITAQLVGRPRRSIQRDLQGLVEAGLIVAQGEGRALRYRLANF